MVVGLRLEGQLAQDLAHVALDGLELERQRLGDAMVRRSRRAGAATCACAARRRRRDCVTPSVLQEFRRVHLTPAGGGEVEGAIDESGGQSGRTESGGRAGGR